jgi:hypothetical protein
MGGYPAFPCTKIYDFSHRRWPERMGFVYLLVIQTSASGLAVLPSSLLEKSIWQHNLNLSMISVG